MRSISRRLLLALVAVLAIGALGAASASAALPEFSPAGTTLKPIKFTVSGQAAEFLAEGSENLGDVCGKTTGEGSITGTKALTVKLRFKECHAKNEPGRTCNSAGAASGEVVSEELKSTLAYISKSSKEVGIVLNNEGASPVFALWTCIIGPSKDGLQRGVIAKITTPLNVKGKTVGLSLKKVGKVNSPSQYENEAGEKVTRTLWGNVLGAYPEVLADVALSDQSELGSFKETPKGTGVEMEVKA